MKIPTSFQLLGQKYTVKLITQSQWEDPSCWGSFNPATREIHILDRGDTDNAQTYMHEVVHVVLVAMGREKLNKDEAFVDLMGSMLQQILTTATYRKR